MKLQVHPEKLHPDLNTLGFVVDVAMILLVIINLGWIVFDWIFAIDAVQGVFREHTADFHDFYKATIHENFLYYDLMFVAVYLTEFTIRWIIAVVRQAHHRWFFFPFIHWYDLLGCIPVAGLRWLRVLRVVSLLLRLQRMGVIDMTNTWLGQTAIKYYRILIEELSDRVVLNVLDGIQRQVGSGNPLIHSIEDEVLAPRKQELVDYLAVRIGSAARETHQLYRADLGRYLSQLTDEALARTDAGRRLATIPVAGPRALALLGDAVREVGVALTDQVVEDLNNPEYRPALDRLLADLISQAGGDREHLNTLVQETTRDIIEQIKAAVRVQQWKLDEEQGRRTS